MSSTCILTPNYDFVHPVQTGNCDLGLNSPRLSFKQPKKTILLEFELNLMLQKDWNYAECGLGETNVLILL